MTSIIHIGCRIIILSIFSIAFSAILCELQNFTIFYYSQYKKLFNISLLSTTFNTFSITFSTELLFYWWRNSQLTSYNDVTLCVCVCVYCVLLLFETFFMESIDLTIINSCHKCQRFLCSHSWFLLVDDCCSFNLLQIQRLLISKNNKRNKEEILLIIIIKKCLIHLKRNRTF